jgi:hypothetical protein
LAIIQTRKSGSRIIIDDCPLAGEIKKEGYGEKTPRKNSRWS